MTAWPGAVRFELQRPGGLAPHRTAALELPVWVITENGIVLKRNSNGFEKE